MKFRKDQHRAAAPAVAYSERQARADCLMAAVESRTAGEIAGSIVARAEQYFRFVEGEAPRETGKGQTG